MTKEEPGFQKLGKIVFRKTVFKKTIWLFSGFLVLQVQTGFASLFEDSANSILLQTLAIKAQQAISEDPKFENSVGSDSVEFSMCAALKDQTSTTVKLKQTVDGLEVIGQEALVHFDQDGNFKEIKGQALAGPINTKPHLSIKDATQILYERYQQEILLSEYPQLKIFKDFEGSTHLVYTLLTQTTPTHQGQEVFLDAHTGEIILEFERAYHIANTVYSADTDLSRQNVDAHGYPITINFSWYEKSYENGKRIASIDRSVLNAARNADRVYRYFMTRFNRRSYDDKDSPITSVVHMGIKWNNAFWTNEFKMMGYGSGDGDHFIDLTYGLDVAAHELTHGITASTAKLVYAGEPGALNESYSDFFAKMVDHTENNWNIGETVVSSKHTRRSIRNMKNPEKFNHPGTNDSPLRVPTTGPCTRENDRCGVHFNSGIPNRAAVLIVESIGKEKSERLYYNVLTQRLTATSTFQDAKEQTILECAELFGTYSKDCLGVRKAYEIVKM